MQYGIYLASVGDFSNPILLAEFAHEAEAVGWDGVFIWDHIGQPHAAADPWVALAAMAMKTERVKLGTVVTPVARRRPWKLARETVSLDHLSERYSAAGVTWWLEDLSTERFSSLQEVRQRLRKGPPGV